MLKSDTKVLEYVQSSSKEIYKEGGNVTMKYRDQLFSFLGSFTVGIFGPFFIHFSFFFHFILFPFFLKIETENE